MSNARRTVYVKQVSESTSADQSKPKRTTDRDRASLTRQSILTVGIEAADHRGVAKLTMRGLAAALDYEVMSLYNHVANKADLLAGMVDQAVGGIDLPPRGHQWQPAMRRSCLSAHRVLSAHPWISALWSTTSIGPARMALMESWLDTLHSTDLTAPVAHRGFHALSNHVVGFALQEAEISTEAQPGPALEDFTSQARAFLATLDAHTYPRMAQHVEQHLHDAEIDGSFTFVLDLILDGLTDTR